MSNSIGRRNLITLAWFCAILSALVAVAIVVSE